MRNNYIILKNVLIILVWLINIANLSSQEFIPSDFSNYYFTPKNIGLSTPQVTDMIKYGNQGVNYYNGLLDTSIPLNGYKDNDFDIPLSIKYLSSGFIPSKRPNIVGHNWVLNFGGVISRTVNGSPDDTKGYYTNSSRGLDKYLKDGLLVPIRTETFKIYSQEDLLNFKIDLNKNGHNTPYFEDSQYDLEPDIFTFSFGYHQGRFIINNEGKISLLSGDTQYKIDISKLSIQEYSTTEAPKTSTIIITTPDGYIYEFGGDVSYLEYFIPNNPEGASVKPRYITSWYLKSIKTPNSRIAYFSYITVYQPYKYNTFAYSFNKTTIQPFPSPPIVVPMGRLDSKQIEMEDKIYTPIFNSLEIDGDLRIKFSIVDKTRFYDDNDSFSKSLDTIAYYYNGKRIKQESFDYEEKGAYFFLNSLQNTDGGKYTFNYNLNKELPSPLTISLDHWGFWNGDNTIKVSNAATYCYYIEDNKKVNSLVSDITLLNKITYPTGGYSEIKYEPNYYTKYHIRDKQKIHLNLLETKADTICGGARVKSITDFDYVSQKQSNYRKFYYKKNKAAKGSGVLGLKPKYRIDERSIRHVVEDNIMYNYITDYIDISANTFGTNNLFEEYHVGYSDVIEEFQDGSYNYYTYSSRIDIPDNEESIYGMSRLLIPSSLSDTELAEKHNLYITNDMSRYRGQLLSKAVYSSQGNPVQVFSYTYNTDDVINNYNISLSFGIRGGHTAYKIYLKPLLLKEEQIVDSNNTVITKKYYYNKQNQVSTQEMSNSDNLFWSLSHKYITDFPYQTLSAPGQKLYDKNIINTPFSTLKTIRDTIDNKTLVVDAVTYDYKIEHDLPLIYNLYKLNTSTPVSEGGSAFNSNLQIRETYNNYDSYGNPIYMTKDGVTKVVYLWGYNGQYPIAEIKNSTYEDVKEALKVDPGSLSSAPEPKMDLVNSLRTELPRAQVTTYTYYPLIGMASVTDPRGITTKYSYGWGGKLHLVYTEEDGKEKLLKQYEYELPGYLHLRPSPPVYPDPEELSPDPYKKGKASTVLINIGAKGDGSYGLTGWNYDTQKVELNNVITKTYKTIEASEYVWTTENLRLKYGTYASINMNWINLTQADVDKYANEYLNGQKIPFEEFEQVFGSWATLYDVAMMYRNIYWGVPNNDGTFDHTWGLPTKEDLWQMYGQAPRTSGNVYEDIKDFLFASACDNKYNWTQNMFNRRNISGLTLTPLGMRESNQGGAIYGFGQVVSLQTSDWAKIETLSDRDLSGVSGIISNPYSYHFTQARHRRPLTDQELSYKMYIDAASDQVLMLPYNQVSSLPELAKGLERGIALRYANREHLKVLKKWSEIQAEATEIKSKLTPTHYPAPPALLPCEKEPETEITADPYTKGKESSVLINIGAKGDGSYGLTGWNYDTQKVELNNVITKTYKTIETSEYQWTTENLRLKYGAYASINMTWVNLTQADVDKYSVDYLGGKSVPLDEFEQVYGTWSTLYDVAMMYRNIYWGVPTGEGTFNHTWGLPTKEDIWQMYGQAPRTTDNFYNDIKDFLFASSSDFKFGWTQGLFKNKNISGLTLTPLGMRESYNGGAIYGFGQVTSLQTSTWAAIETLSDRDLSGQSGLISNPYSYHFTQARHRRPLTDQELGYKMYIDAANDQVLMLPYTVSSTLPELPKGLERGVALRYANRKAMKVVKKWSEIQAEASEIKSLITK